MIRTLRDRYRPMSREEKDSVAQKAVEAENRAVAVIDAARACLASKEFETYRTLYENTEKELINDISEYVEPDPLKYAFEMQSKVEKLRALKVLLNRVCLDARGRPTDDKK